MRSANNFPRRDLAQRLAEAEATIEALLSGQIDAVVDSKSKTPVLLSKAQEALRESEERYRRIVETSNEGICSIDARSKITLVNRRLAELLGYAVEQTVGMSLYELMPAENAASAARRLDRAAHGASEESEVKLLRKDGTELWTFFKTTPIRDNDGRFVGTLAMITDRTRHHQDEEALRKSEEQYRQIVEATSDGIIKIDGKESIVFVNRRYAEMLGYEPREMIGMSLYDVMSDEARASAATDSMLQVRAAIDTTLRHKDGRGIAVNIAVTRLVDGEGHVVGHLGMVRDVTERKKLQSQLMVSDRMASVGTLAAGVAHEINNPLAAVVANLEYISESLDRTGGTERSDAWLLAESRSRSMTRVTRPSGCASSCAISRCSRARPPTRRTTPVDVETRPRVVAAHGVERDPPSRAAGADYGRVPFVGGNEARLGQVFLNLIVNAAQAMPEGRAEHNEIRVSTPRRRRARHRRGGRHRARHSARDHRRASSIPSSRPSRSAWAPGSVSPICQRIVTRYGGRAHRREQGGRGQHLHRRACPAP